MLMKNYGLLIILSILFSCSNFDDEMSSHLNQRPESGSLFYSSAKKITTGSLRIDAPNVKYNQTISFVAKCSKLGCVSLSHGDNTPYSNGKICIDSVNLTIYNSLLDVDGVYPHGLTFCDNISIRIEQGEYTDAVVNIQTNGGGVF